MPGLLDCSHIISTLHLTAFSWHHRTNGRGSEWDVRSEKRVADFDVGAPPACSAWDPANPANLAVVSRGANETYLLRHEDSSTGRFRKGYTRRCSCCWRPVSWGPGLVLLHLNREHATPLPGSKGKVPGPLCLLLHACFFPVTFFA